MVTPSPFAEPQGESSLHDVRPDGKKPCLKVSRPTTNGSDFCVWKWTNFDINAEFDGAEEGDSITVELVYMTDKEFEDLGAFEGW